MSGTWTTLIVAAGALLLPTSAAASSVHYDKSGLSVDAFDSLSDDGRSIKVSYVVPKFVGVYVIRDPEGVDAPFYCSQNGPTEVRCTDSHAVKNIWLRGHSGPDTLTLSRRPEDAVPKGTTGYIYGGGGGDRLSGHNGTDYIYGGGGSDLELGGGGADALGVPEPFKSIDSGKDYFRAQGGPDAIQARDNQVDGEIRCGRGNDAMKRDKFDPKAISC